MPMQLAEACMSAEFINLYLLWAGGELRRWKRRWEEEGSNTHAGFVPTKPESVWRKWGEKIERLRKEKKQRNLLKYALILFVILSRLPTAWWLFSQRFTFPLRADRLFAFATVAMGSLKAAQGLNPISTLPSALQQSYQRLALDSLLWSGFRPLMNSDDEDKWWWHSQMSRTCHWSLEFLMKWIEFYPPCSKSLLSVQSKRGSCFDSAVKTKMHRAAKRAQQFIGRGDHL